MGPYQSNFGQFMERRTSFNVNLALDQYFSQLNQSHQLSKEEEDELADHILSEVKDLEEAGLTPEEAFIIGQKRLGHTEILATEYQKARPWSRIIQLIASAIVFIFGYKMIFNLIQIFSVSMLLGLSRFTDINIESYMVWGDLALQIAVFLGAICLGAFFMKRLIVRNLKYFWPIPVVYFLSEIAKAAISILSTGLVAMDIYGVNILNGRYIQLASILIMVIASLWIIFKNKEQVIKLA